LERKREKGVPGAFVKRQKDCELESVSRRKRCRQRPWTVGGGRG
jgi:hypothetical protein